MGSGRTGQTCDAVVEQGYLGFRLTGPSGTHCNDGVVNRLQPDVRMMLQMMAELDLPPLDSLPVAEARAFSDALAQQRPPGPDVGEIVDATLPGAAGELDYRIYRPSITGPHPVVVYFHGGGWVLGSHDSDDPFCRDLCDRTGAMIVSVDYRHGPRRGSRPPPRTHLRLFGGLPPTPNRSVGYRVGWPSPAGAPAPTSPPASANVREMPAVRRSSANCWSHR